MISTQKQLLEAGHGMCSVTLKRDDSERLAEIIPEDRKEDVIWIEPSSSREKVSGFNFISVGLAPDDPNFDTALSTLVADTKKMLDAEKYWGPHMDRIAGNIIRAMNEFNRSHPNEPDLNFADMYYVLADRASRQEFTRLAGSIGMGFIEDYTEKIAEMNNLEPILGRMQDWIEEPTARRMICSRDSGVDIPSAVENDKIIVVRVGREDKDLKQMVGMAVIRRIWAAIRAQSDQEDHNRNPFYLFVDEGHLIAQADDAFPEMLAAARNLRLSINIATQKPRRLSESVVYALGESAASHALFSAEPVSGT